MSPFIPWHNIWCNFPRACLPSTRARKLWSYISLDSYLNTCPILLSCSDPLNPALILLTCYFTHGFSPFSYINHPFNLTSLLLTCSFTPVFSLLLPTFGASIYLFRFPLSTTPQSLLALPHLTLAPKHTHPYFTYTLLSPRFCLHPLFFFPLLPYLSPPSHP